MKYRTVDEWLDEIENFSMRRERMPPEAEAWVRTAWRLGALSIAGESTSSSEIDDSAGAPRTGE